MSDVARAFGKSGGALLGLCLVVGMALAAVVAPALAPHDPDAIDTARRLARPFTAGHLLGTDEFGRDLLSRLLHGARISLVVGLAATALAALAGSLCGLLAGFLGRWVDQAIMRGIDTLMAFPYFLLAIAIIAVLGPGLVNGMVAVAIVNIPFYGRIVRATVLAVKQTEYVEAARALGVSEVRLSLTHVLRNCLAPLIVAITLNVGGHDHGAGRAVLPGPRRAAADVRLGQHARQQPPVHQRRAARGGVPRPGHLPHRARLQPAGRRPSRRARPAAPLSREIAT